MERVRLQIALQETGTISDRDMKEQALDDMDLERESARTITAQK